MSIIKTEHLTHIYSQGTPYERAALQDFNIEIEEGEFAGIIGHTGSGKSTFIRIYSNYIRTFTTLTTIIKTKSNTQIVQIFKF